ncbi:MAG: hypothetical protein [Malazfec virus 1]
MYIVCYVEEIIMCDGNINNLLDIDMTMFYNENMRTNVYEKDIIQVVSDEDNQL